LANLVASIALSVCIFSLHVFSAVTANNDYQIGRYRVSESTLT